MFNHARMGSLVRGMRQFVDVNCRISDRISRGAQWLGRREGLHAFHHELLPGSLRPAMRVLDVGGGKRPAIDVHTKRRLGLHVTGLDISAEQLALAPPGSYDEVIVGDVTTVQLPPRFDLVFSVTVLEHVADNRAALKNLVSALAPGGSMLHYVPSALAPFAVVNRLLGNRIARKLLFALYPEARERSGFPAYYHLCVPSWMRGLCQANGLEGVQTTSYFHSEYCRFFTPFHVMEVARQLTLQLLGFKDLAEAFILRAHQPHVAEGAAHIERRAAA